MRILILIFLLAACDNIRSPTPVVAGKSRSVLDWMPPNFVVAPRSATQPVFAEPEIIFTVNRGDCSPATDRSGASDCDNKTTRSVISTGKVWDEGVEWQLGHQYRFSFEFWIDPDLAYPGYRNSAASLSDNFSSSLSIARWTGAEFPKNQLFDLKVDATRGVTFLGRTCISPSQFGGWHRFTMRLRWANNSTGFVEVRCDGSLYHGLPIYAASNISTNQALHCFAENNCEPGVHKDPRRFNMQLGILFDPAIVNGRAAFPRIKGGGLTVRMRRFEVRRLYVIFGRVEGL